MRGEREKGDKKMGQEIEVFFDERTWTLSYVVYDSETRDAVVLDPVLDYEPASSKIWTESADELIAFIRGKELTLHYILETHAHADHLSGSQILKEAFPQAKIAIGARITEVQKLFKGVFDLPAHFAVDGSQFDELLQAGESYTAGTLTFDVIATPGHTPADVTFKFGDAIFTGDALFMPDMGTGRCDFPGGSAEDMYDSIMTLYDLPADTQVYVGHDYMPGGRELANVAPLSEHIAHNVALPRDRSREDFVSWRKQRDAGLKAPNLLFQSVQVNVDAGALPKPSEDSGRAYLKIPVNVFRPVAKAEDMSIDEVGCG